MPDPTPLSYGHATGIGPAPDPLATLLARTKVKGAAPSSWDDPENDSVLDSSTVNALRALYRFLGGGSTDVSSQIMGVTNPGNALVGETEETLAGALGKTKAGAAVKRGAQKVGAAIKDAPRAIKESGALGQEVRSKSLRTAMLDRMAEDAPSLGEGQGVTLTDAPSGLVSSSGVPASAARGGIVLTDMQGPPWKAPEIYTSKTKAAARPKPLAGRALPELAQTAKVTDQPGRYDLRAPTEDRLGDLYTRSQSMEKPSDWQGGTEREDLVNAFGGDVEMARRWLRLWGATSPNTSGVRNTQESVSALLHSYEHPDTPLTKGAARRLRPMKITMAGSKVPNINNAIAGLPLSGDKVEAMSGFMLGDPRIPIDVHALYALGPGQRDPERILDKQIPGLRKLMNTAEGRVSTGKNRNQLSKTDIYKRYEDALRRTLQSFDPQRDANQIFADLWEATRQHKGLAYQGGPIDHLRNQGLMEAGAMLDPKRLRKALKTSGWTSAAIAGLLASLGHDPTETPDEATAPDETAAPSMRSQLFDAVGAQ